MTALASERLTEKYGEGRPSRRTIPLRAGAKVFKGGMVGVDNAGNAMAAGLLAGGTVRVRGVASANADQAAGVAKAEVAVGVFKLTNFASDLITAADEGTDCYVVDDQTVAKTDGTGTRAVAGKVERVDSDGVRVWFQ